MKPLILSLCCIVVTMGVRLFVSPLLSMKAIGEARSVVYSTYDLQGPGDPRGVDVADSIESSLHRSHRAWQLTDLAIDLIILAILVLGFSVLVRAKRLQSASPA